MILPPLSSLGNYRFILEITVFLSSKWYPQLLVAVV